MDRFKELVHYICGKCDPQKLGATRLNKILWFADTITYRRTFKSLTGENAYKKDLHGPVPKRMDDILSELVGEEKFQIKDEMMYGPFGPYMIRIFTVLKQASSDWMQEEDRILVDKLIKVVCEEHSAKSISEETHNLIYDAAERGEDIPINAVLAETPDEITEEDKKWANSILAEMGIIK